MKEKKTYKSSWYEFTPEWCGFALNYELSGYYDTKPVLQVYIIWGKLFLYFPWTHYKKVEREKTIKELRKDKIDKLLNPNLKIKKSYKKEVYDECEPPSYGFYFHMDQLGIHFGKKTKLYDLPWCFDWIRTSALRKDGKWEHETKNNRNRQFYDKNKWKDILYIETFPYTYTLKNGEIQNCLATIRVDEREWRWKWFKWLSFPKRISKSIDVEFSSEVGERTGSWKGGTTGCGYDILKNETPYECLKRMEKERKF